MDVRLRERAMAAGHRLIALEAARSTNGEALEMARRGEAGPLWIVTDRQSDGRGRRARSWASPAGNLAATFMQVMTIAPGAAATLGFAAGLALIEALKRIEDAGRRTAAPDAPAMAAKAAPAFRLKWPNDVLADGRKLAGILLESDRLPGGEIALVVGFGVNVVAAPADMPYPATALAALGIEACAADLFESLAECWPEALARWHGGAGMAELRGDWLARAAGIGEPVTIDHEGERISGRFETIDEWGRLVLRDAQGARRMIAAGDVFFGRTGSVREGADKI